MNQSASLQVSKPPRYALIAGLITGAAYLLAALLPLMVWFGFAIALIGGPAVLLQMTALFILLVILAVAAGITMLVMNIHYILSGKVRGVSRVIILIFTVLYFLAIASVGLYSIAWNSVI